MSRENAERLLKTALGNSAATFRDGQWEAIDALVNQRRKMLVVQRTGWGKSVVYFLSTRLLRDKGAGPTIIISPLLSLMRNQMEAAARIGIRAESINSTNNENWRELERDILNDKVDALLISPERLANDTFVGQVLTPIADRIGLFVVDEAHCISDWGHDFRPDYKRLVNIIRRMPSNMPLLGTTATANNRVIEDIQQQFGDIIVSRGPLMRDSLVLENIRLSDQAARLAWLAQYIPTMSGTGIVYTLTTNMAERVAEWLNLQGIDAKAYHSQVKQDGFEDTNAYREHLESMLLNNELKVLIATVALGMGYDKPDLSFVVHFQTAGNVVGYYQQVGRAGRGIPRALGIQLSGREDADIHEYFRESAFPPSAHVMTVLQELEKADGGLTLNELEARLNLKHGQIEKVLKVLSVENPSPILKDGTKWNRTAVHYQVDEELVRKLIAQREQEWHEMEAYIDHKGCLMRYLGEALDDTNVQNCGRCENCTGTPAVSKSIDHNLAVKAALFLKHADIVFKPRKQIPRGALPSIGMEWNIPKALQAEEGRIVSQWGDAGWGKVVADDKYKNHFRDELVAAMAEMIKERWKPDPFPTWIACVPSNNHPELVPDFSMRLAEHMGLPFKNVVVKVTDNDAQKLQANSFHQCHNLDGVFEIQGEVPTGPVLLVDDMIDSGWTMTIIALLLRRAGSGPVFSTALASTRSSD